MKESNDIKAKRIFSLESQAQEASNHIANHKCPISENASSANMPNDINDAFHYIKVNSLESRTNAMEHNLTLLISKVDNIQMILAMKPSTTEASLV